MENKKWGGARTGSGRKPYPEIKPGGIVIDVHDARVYVSRWRRNKAGGFLLEEATNWQELEDVANAEVAAFGGHVTISGIYHCSDELAQKAEWSNGTL